MNKAVLWMWLCVNVNLKRAKQLRLLEKFKNIENIYNAGLSEYAELDFLTHEEMNLLLKKDLTEVEKEYYNLSNYGVYTLTIDEPDYPRVLKHIYDPPTLLYCKGRFVDFNSKLCLSIVGTRKATPYGKSAAYSLSKTLASNGVVVVSGMALGIDTKAHEGALAAGEPTVAVIGCGPDVVYPKSNANLMKEIEKTGMIISEYPLHTAPAKFHFPERNRIISGISQGTIVVEADIKSGSLITAKSAGEQGREIFAVPGNINSLYSKGSNQLIKDGAKIALCAEDIICEFKNSYAERVLNSLNHEEPVFSERRETYTPPPESNSPEDMIMEIIKSGPANVDKICEITRLDTGSVNSALLLMELKGVIIKSVGGYYELNSMF